MGSGTAAGPFPPVLASGPASPTPGVAAVTLIVEVHKELLPPVVVEAKAGRRADEVREEFEYTLAV